MTRCCMVLVMLAVGVVTQARNYYIDANGNDAVDGSRAHPWKTVAALGRVRLAAGDSVFFHGGQVFPGTLKIETVAGKAMHPVWIGSFGGGQATLDGGDSSGVVLYRDVWVEVQHLRLVGAGRKTGNVKNGLFILECRHVEADDIDITGFQKVGLMIYASAEVVIRRIYAHENGSAGIAVEGEEGKRSSRELKILECRADDNPGDPTNLTNHSGNGIVCGHCTHLLIEDCSATNNGWDMPRIGNGPVGIWCYEADSVIIRHCLAYKNKTSPGAADGGGFDLDGGVTHSIIENCLSYGNQGAGYCLFQYWGASPWHHNIIRNNISEDDGLVSDARAGIYVWNSSGDSTQLHDCEVYNNTVYNTKEAAVSYSDKSARQGFSFYKNIFVGADSLIRGDRGADSYRGNVWWVLRRDDRACADAAEGGKAKYVKPAFRDPGNTRVTKVSEMSGYDKYALPQGSVGAKF